MNGDTELYKIALRGNEDEEYWLNPHAFQARRPALAIQDQVVASLSTSGAIVTERSSAVIQISPSLIVD